MAKAKRTRQTRRTAKEGSYRFGLAVALFVILAVGMSFWTGPSSTSQSLSFSAPTAYATAWFTTNDGTKYQISGTLDKEGRYANPNGIPDVVDSDAYFSISFQNHQCYVFMEGENRVQPGLSTLKILDKSGNVKYESSTYSESTFSRGSKNDNFAKAVDDGDYTWQVECSKGPLNGKYAIHAGEGWEMKENPPAKISGPLTLNRKYYFARDFYKSANSISCGTKDSKALYCQANTVCSN